MACEDHRQITHLLLTSPALAAYCMNSLGGPASCCTKRSGAEVKAISIAPAPGASQEDCWAETEHAGNKDLPRNVRGTTPENSR